MSKTAAEDGVTITILRTGLTIPHDNHGGRVGIRGEVVHLTAQQVEDTKNRFGVSWLSMTPEDQLAAWGEPRFLLGTPPEDEPITLGGDDPHGFRYRAWMRATELAQKLSDPGERAAALAKVKADYPEQKVSTQWTLSNSNGS